MTARLRQWTTQRFRCISVHSIGSRPASACPKALENTMFVSVDYSKTILYINAVQSSPFPAVAPSFSTHGLSFETSLLPQNWSIRTTALIADLVLTQSIDVNRKQRRKKSEEQKRPVSDGLAWNAHSKPLFQQPRLYSIQHLLEEDQYADVQASILLLMNTHTNARRAKLSNMFERSAD